MAAEAPPYTGAGTGAGGGARVAPSQLASIWAKHLVSFLLPANALAFLWTGPHPWYVAPFFLLPTIGALFLDDGPKVERRQPVASLPAWPFDAIVYALAAAQLLVVVEIGRMFAHQAVFSLDMLMSVVVVGGSSGFSIITAHELIHRRKPWERQLGRLLLCTVLQEHFFTEHLRGHHVRVGLAEDPATARYGETYEAFYRRTVPAQFRGAWRLERRRLRLARGEGEVSLLDPRVLVRHRVVQGLVVGWGMAAVLWLLCGWAALLAFLLQALMASRLLEAVNYFEHWGLRRRGGRVRPCDSWDTHSWFTYYGLVGLSRHADHHYEPARPYQQLRIRERVPMLPSGYVGMVDLVMGKNEEFRALASAELERCRLGPFEEGAEPAPEAEPVASAGTARASGLRGRWQGLPPAWRAGLVGVAIVVAVSAGGALEAGSLQASSFGSTLLANAWILGVFLVIGRIRRRLEERGLHGGVAWAAALSLLVVVGLLTDAVVRALT